MGDSTQRQIWATFLSPFQSNDFERNAKMWTRENCARQYPHRKKHPSGGHFPEEGEHFSMEKIRVLLCIYMLRERQYLSVFESFMTVSTYQYLSIVIINIRHHHNHPHNHRHHYHPHPHHHHHHHHRHHIGWGGKCGNNEVTCDLSGFGPKGRVSASCIV